MYKPAGLINIMNQNNENTNDVDSKEILIPKRLIALFLTLNLIWGFDFGFMKYFNKNTQKIAQFATFLINIFVIVVLGLPCIYIHPTYVAWLLVNLLQYIIDFVILNCTKYKLYDFLNDVSDLRNSNKSVTINNFSIFMMMIYLFGILSMKYVLFVYQNNKDVNNFTSLLLELQYVYGIFCFCIDVVPFALIIVNYYTYLSLKNVKEAVYEVTDNISNVVDQYEAIADHYDKITPLYDKIVST